MKLNIKWPKLFIAGLTIFCAYFTEIVSSSAVTAVLLPVVNREVRVIFALKKSLKIFCYWQPQFQLDVSIFQIEIFNIPEPQALALRINPLFFLLPMTVSASFAFMLPSASPCVSIRIWGFRFQIFSFSLHCRLYSRLQANHFASSNRPLPFQNAIVYEHLDIDILNGVGECFISTIGAIVVVNLDFISLLLGLYREPLFLMETF